MANQQWYNWQEVQRGTSPTLASYMQKSGPT